MFIQQQKLNLNIAYKTKCNFSLITAESLLHYINATNIIDKVFNYEDPNQIADTLINEINRCIETIALSKLIQCTKKHCRW